MARSGSVPAPHQLMESKMKQSLGVFRVILVLAGSAALAGCGSGTAAPNGTAGAGGRSLSGGRSAGGTPAATGGVPVATGGVPVAAGGVPVPTGGVPVATGGVPVATGGVPVATGGVPVATGGVPVATGGVPVATGGVPVATGGTTSGGTPPPTELVGVWTYTTTYPNWTETYTINADGTWSYHLADIMYGNTLCPSAADGVTVINEGGTLVASGSSVTFSYTDITVQCGAGGTPKDESTGDPETDTWAVGPCAGGSGTCLTLTYVGVPTIYTKTGGVPVATGGVPVATGGVPAATGGVPAATGGVPVATGGTTSGGTPPPAEMVGDWGWGGTMSCLSQNITYSIYADGTFIRSWLSGTCTKDTLLHETGTVTVTGNTITFNDTSYTVSTKNPGDIAYSPATPQTPETWTNTWRTQTSTIEGPELCLTDPVTLETCYYH